MLTLANILERKSALREQRLDVSESRFRKDHSGRAQLSRVAWWQWPHLLSLDAPLVAMIWQRGWARSTGIRLAWNQEVMLILGVWLIYLSDRLMDTLPWRFERHQTARHDFYRLQHASMRRLAVVIFVGLVCIAVCHLPRRQLFLGWGLLALAGAYFRWVHRRAARCGPSVLPKEAVVGGIFSLGTAFFVLCQVESVTPELLTGMLSFAGLCFLNCAMITKWERNEADMRDATSLLNAFPRLVGYLDASCIALALFAMVLRARSPLSPMFPPLALSALFLVALDWWRQRISVNLLRVLADVALLTPLICPMRSPLGP